MSACNKTIKRQNEQGKKKRNIKYLDTEGSIV